MESNWTNGWGLLSSSLPEMSRSLNTYESRLASNNIGGATHSNIGGNMLVPAKPPANIIPFTKDDYVKILRTMRKKFVHDNFKDVLEKVFADLKSDAEKMRPCHREIPFEIPEHFDIDKTEATLCAYFADIGYKTLTEARKGSTTRIVITLTF